MFFLSLKKKILIFLFILSIIFFSAILSIFERRILGFLQNRYGPNRVGWQGSLQIFADGIKILFKEDWIPPFSDRFTFIVAPLISFLSFLLVFVVIPFTNTFVIVNLDIGVLFFLMISSISIYGVLLAGWSSNNKYALLGSIRASAQVLSYEIFLGLSIMGVVARAGSFNIIDIVNSQKNLWNIIPQFFGFFSFLIASIAVCHRHPFDQPESEQELADGYHIEYSGMKFGMFFIGEYISILCVSSLIVCFFLGGWFGPFLPPFICFFIKTIFIIFLFILFRASLPRPRYDQVLNFSWKIGFPLTLINLLFTSFLVLMNFI